MASATRTHKPTSALTGAAVGMVVALFAIGISVPANAQSGAFDTLTLEELRKALRSDNEIEIVQESRTQSGMPVIIVQYEGLRTAVGLKLDSQQRGIGLVHVAGYPGPISARMPVNVINDINLNSEFGWFAKAPSGTTVYQHGGPLYGSSAKAITFAVKLFTAVYATRGAEYSTVAFEGGETSPGERRIDASHQPAAAIGLSQDAAAIFEATGDMLKAEEAFGDAQRYGNLRKLANTALGN